MILYGPEYLGYPENRTQASGNAPYGPVRLEQGLLLEEAYGFVGAKSSFGSLYHHQ